jgi:CheY-like chemotaxis protein
MENLGLMAGGVAHDLKNLFSPILAYPDFISEKLPPDSDLLHPLAMIKKSALRAAELIQNFLTMARRGKYQLEPMDINRVIEDYASSPDFQELTERYPRVKISLELTPSLPPARGLPSQFMNVIMNLVRNGCEATAEGGSLKISTRPEKLDFPLKGFQQIPRGEYVVIEVADEGKGIPADKLNSIFTPFISGKKMGRSGSGLGLAVVLGVVEDHQGYLDVASEVGRGTAFSIYLPAFEPEEGNRVSLPVPAAALVVDDDEFERRQMAMLLSEMGYRVNSVADGKEAIKYAGNHRVDLLIADISLREGENGLEICRRIFEINPPQQALVISGSLTAESREEAARMRIGCLEKPLSREKLIPFIPREKS